MKIDIYTDGSATTVDKPGGWAYVVTIDGVKHSEGNGHMPNASNNDAELEAAIQGLKYVKKEYVTLLFLPGKAPPVGEWPEPADVTLVSDSQLVLGWISGRYAFRQLDKMDKFKNLQLLVHEFDVKTRWVEGHTGDEHNERCDTLANEARKMYEIAVKPKKKKQVTANIEVIVDSDKLDELACKAIFWADSGIYTRGSNYWRTMFVDKLKELLDNNTYYTIEIDK